MRKSACRFARRKLLTSFNSFVTKMKDVPPLYLKIAFTRPKGTFFAKNLLEQFSFKSCFRNFMLSAKLLSLGRKTECCLKWTLGQNPKLLKTKRDQEYMYTKI